MPKVKWVMSYKYCSKFHMFSSSAKIWKSVKIWHSYTQFKGGNFFETQCRWDTSIQSIKCASVHQYATFCLFEKFADVSVYPLFAPELWA